jgi:hypothetical protein
MSAYTQLLFHSAAREKILRGATAVDRGDDDRSARATRQGRTRSAHGIGGTSIDQETDQEKRQ